MRMVSAHSGTISIPVVIHILILGWPNGRRKRAWLTREPYPRVNYVRLHAVVRGFLLLMICAISSTVYGGVLR
jgi:hypothetical protein